MIKEGIKGFCMALADSVPGVSGGTVAFIMGFYDNFINSIHNIVFGKLNEKKTALLYLLKLGVGWAIGMLLAVVILSSLFDSQIYIVSSLFIGFIAGAIPLIIIEEKESFKSFGKGIIFAILGIAIVAGITFMNSQVGTTTMNLNSFSPLLGVKLFLIGMCAISAMFLPGISGSTLLLIFGAYIPVITAVRGIIGLDFSYLPAILCFGLGIIVGAVTVVKGIKICLEKFRVQSLYAILGMMIGSFYAIIQGPTTLDLPKEAINFSNFNFIACVIGLALVIGMYKIKERSKKNGI